MYKRGKPEENSELSSTEDETVSSTKRGRQDGDGQQLTVIQEREKALVEVKQTQALVSSNPLDGTGRTSKLSAPTMLLSGHEAAIYSICFDPSGQHLVSGSLDRNLLLWDVYGECKNYNILSGHKNAVLEVKWASNGNHIMSCSADKTVAVWDANKGRRIRKLTDHTGIVNSISVCKNDHNLFATASDDCTVLIWDARSKRSIKDIYHDYQVTSVCISNDGKHVYSGGIDNIIRRWDLAADEAEEDLKLTGHKDTVTGLALSNNGNFLLSNGMDSSLLKWDVRPFIPEGQGRCQVSYVGLHHGAEKGLLRCSFSADQQLVAGGSADRIVHIWETLSGKQLYFLPGHKGAVNEVIFHPNEPIIASCGSDKQIYIGELSGN